MQEEYIQRINKVLSYIEQNLDSELSLSKAAEVGCYSPFHLHRLFKAITNETLNAYIIRKRIERSAMLLVHHRELTVNDIAMKYGFNSNSVFSRTFKKVYGLSPSDFRKKNQGVYSKIGKTDSKFGQVDLLSEEYIRNINHLKNWINMNAKLEVREVPAFYLAYLTQIGEEGLEESFLHVIKWAGSRQLLAQPENAICRVFHDSFKVTDANKVRMSIGLRSDAELKPEGRMSVTRCNPGKCLVGHFEIKVEEFESAWNSLFIWMNERGHKKSEASPFEVYHNNYQEHPEQKCIVDLVIPIV